MKTLLITAFIATVAVWLVLYVKQTIREQAAIDKLKGCKRCRINLKLRGYRHFRPCMTHKPAIEDLRGAHA